MKQLPVNEEQKLKNEKKAAVKKTPEELADIYWSESRKDKIVTLCKEILEKEEYKDSPFWLEMLSKAYCHLACWKDVIEVNKKRVSLFPKEREAWDVLVIAYAVLGDYNNAAAALKEAEEKMNWDISYNEPDLDSEPGMKEEFYNGGKEGEPSSFYGNYWKRYAMFTLYPLILKKAPKCAAGWYTLALFYGENLCYFDEALKAIEKAVKLKPDWKPALAYHTQILSYLCKDTFDEKEEKALSAKVQAAYEKWDKEKALSRKQKEDKNKERENCLELCETKKDYQRILDICEEALKDQPEIDLVIDSFWLYKQTEAYQNIEQWEDVVKICEKRLEYAKKRRNLYERYEEGEITDEEAGAFHFLDGTQSELYSFAWNSAFRRLASEEENCKETLKLARQKLKKQKE